MDEGEDIYVENPTFRSAYPMEPLHYGKRLRWDFKVNLIGEKVVDPLIHTCETCIQPILSYGRMIPCKHAFCLDCAKGSGKRCARCKESVTRVEQSPLGSVFICTVNGQKQLANGCRRTYLSQRDLNSHVAHRHLANLKASPGDGAKSTAMRNPVQDPGATPRPVEQPVFNPGAAGLLQSVNALLGHLTPQMVPQRNPVSQPAMPRLPIVQQPIVSTAIESYQTSSIPVMSTSRNLITVPIQEEQYRHHGAFPAGFPGQVNPLAPMQPYISSTQVSSSQYPPQIGMAGAHFSTAGVPHPHLVPPPQIMGGQNPPRFSSPHQPFDDKHPPQFNQPSGSPRLPWNSGSRPPGPVPPTQRPHGENSSYNQYY